MAEFRVWFDNRLENAIEAAEEQERNNPNQNNERMYLPYML